MYTSEAGPSRQASIVPQAHQNSTPGSRSDNTAPPPYVTPHHTMPQNTGEAMTSPIPSSSTTNASLHSVITTTEDIRPLLLEHLPKDQPGSIYKRYIRSAADFNRQSSLYRTLSFKPRSNARDFPQTDVELERLAKGLTDAMTSMEDTVEAGKKSLARMQQISPYEFILMSWRLLFVLRDVQLGQVQMDLWGAQWEGQGFDTFMARYEDVRFKLKISKSMVSSLFDQSFLVRLALNPGIELKKKLANLKNNAQRAVELARVRESKKRNVDEENNDGNDIDDEEGTPPRKRARKSKGSLDEQWEAEQSFGEDNSDLHSAFQPREAYPSEESQSSAIEERYEGLLAEHLEIELPFDDSDFA